MANLIILSNLLAAICSALAAYRWLQASQVKDPPAALVGSTGWGSDLVPHAPTAAVDATPLVKWAQESGRLNKVAATWSAVAALFAGLGVGLGLFP